MSDRPPTLEEGVRRIQEAIGKALSTGAQEIERWAGDNESPTQRRERERADRKRRKKEKRLEELREKSPAGGGVMIAIAVVMVVMVFVGFPWWLIFVALGLAIGGVSQLGTKGEIARLERELGLLPDELAGGPVDPARERLKRVDEVAQLLSTEFAEGSEAMRAMVARPRETVDAIRKSCHALADREKKLRQLAKDGVERLESERATLATRRDAETDPVTRERLTAALNAMDEQRKERATLESHANRLEAEQVRLAWSLETLYTQVVKARSTGGGAAPVEDALVRQELERLTNEVGAVAQALEEVADTPLGAAQKGSRTRG